jgi:single-stranded DNA-specific DHH superfamily exonuclease
LIRGMLHMKIKIHGISHIIVLDQGSRGSPPLASNAQVFIIDHHLSDQFPQDAVICSACNHLPVATTSLLTFVVIEPFLKDADPDTKAECEWLAVLGVKGDLGDWKWDPPFPGTLHDKVNKAYTKKALSEAVSLLNARTALLITI